MCRPSNLGTVGGRIPCPQEGWDTHTLPIYSPLLTGKEFIYLCKKSCEGTRTPCKICDVSELVSRVGGWKVGESMLVTGHQGCDPDPV